MKSSLSMLHQLWDLTIDLPGEEGVEYLSNQLRNLSLAMAINDAIGNFLDEDLVK